MLVIYCCVIVVIDEPVELQGLRELKMPMTPTEDDEFTAFLRSKAMEAKVAFDYTPVSFLQMLGSSGGYQTVSALISRAKPSDGFITLWEAGRLDLSVEALITESRWRRCFEASLLSAAETRLLQAGYVVTVPEHPDKPAILEKPAASRNLPPFPKFTLGEEYSRSAVFKMLDLDPEPKGGDWFTGYAEHEGNVFIFCNVGTPGRTGHDYGNHFDGDRLVWSGKGPSKLQHASVQILLKPPGRSYIFYRLSDRGPFTFAGIAKPYQVFDTSPVGVIWEFYDQHSFKPDIDLALQPSSQGTVVEGGAKSVTVKIYERDRGARLKCIHHWGWKCFVCQFDFARTYGELGEGFIHVHHLKPLAEIGGVYDLNPVTDLRPVCPNCHAMLHRKVPALAIEELKIRMTRAKEDYLADAY